MQDVCLHFHIYNAVLSRSLVIFMPNSLVISSLGRGYLVVPFPREDTSIMAEMDGDAVVGM